MSSIKLTEDNLKEAIASNQVIIVDFKAQWCNPCKLLEPVLERISDSLEVTVASVDVDEQETLAKAFNIVSVPALFLFKNGSFVKSRIGYCGYEMIKEWIENDKV